MGEQSHFGCALCLNLDFLAWTSCCRSSCVLMTFMAVLLLAATAGVLVGDRPFFVNHEFIKGRYALDFHNWVDFQCSFANKNCLSGP